MKYNTSTIMKRAWSIKKENTNNIFALCLKMAWAEAKAAKVEKPSTIKTDLVTWTFKTWKKNGMHRVYIDGDFGKHGRGYIDMNTGKVVVTKSHYGGENSVVAAAELYMAA